MPISDERRRLLTQNNAESKLEAKRCIKAALISLLRQNKYEDISMSEIIRKSGVSRMGVYNNYKSKDEIMLDLYRKPLEEVFTTLNSSIYDNLEWIFSTAYRHRSRPCRRLSSDQPFGQDRRSGRQAEGLILSRSGSVKKLNHRLSRWFFMFLYPIGSPMA